MKSIKVVGLAAVAALAAMAFIGTSSALGLEDEIVVCRDLVKTGELCKENRHFPTGTLILALAKTPKLAGTINVECEDVLVTVETLASMSLKLLPLSITSLKFGKLPTPTLGEGCTGCTQIHTATDVGKSYKAGIEVSTEDKWFFETSGSWQLLGCPFGVTCEFGSESILAPIDPDATPHPLLPKDKNGVVYKGDLILIETTLKRTGGSALCGATGKWVASFTVYGCNEFISAGKYGPLEDCWVALYKNLGEV